MKSMKSLEKSQKGYPAGSFVERAVSWGYSPYWARSEWWWAVGEWLMEIFSEQKLSLSYLRIGILSENIPPLCFFFIFDEKVETVVWLFVIDENLLSILFEIDEAMPFMASTYGSCHVRKDELSRQLPYSRN